MANVDTVAGALPSASGPHKAQYPVWLNLGSFVALGSCGFRVLWLPGLSSQLALHPVNFSAVGELAPLTWPGREGRKVFSRFGSPKLYCGDRRQRDGQARPGSVMRPNITARAKNWVPCGFGAEPPLSSRGDNSSRRPWGFYFLTGLLG